jgi:hypothetical protein
MQPAIAGDPLPRIPPCQDQYRNNHHNKRREEFPDIRYGTQHVAAVQDNSGAGGSQRQKTGTHPWAGQKKQWVEKKAWQGQPKYTMESAMDQPCRWHTPNPAKPANHLTKDCSWTKILMERGLMKDARDQGFDALPPPPLLTGANAQPVFAQQNQPHQQQGVHQMV